MRRLLLSTILFFVLSNLLFAGRYYDAAIGRFLTVDPLANKYPSFSPYNYTLNNPLNYIDPDGKEANKSQATSPRNFLSYLQYVNKNNAKETLSYLGNYKTLGGADPSHKRYIYTRRGGWIDLVHFFNVASEIDKLSSIKKVGVYLAGEIALWEKTKSVEDDQLAKGSVGTAWSYEDAPSNFLGLIFWKHYYDPKGDLIEQIIKFLKDFGATDPENAPNWQEMWTKEHPYKQQFPQDKSAFPDFTSGEEDNDDWWSDYDPSKH